MTLAIYKATIVWHGHDSSVYVLAAEGGPLIGMALLHGNRVTLDVVDDGPVTVEELPRSTQYAATLLDARAGDADYKSTYHLSLYLEQVVQHFSRYRKYASAVLGQNSV